MERHEITMILASNLQAAMERRGVNAAELARKAHLNPTGVYDILSGKSRSPRLDTVAKIAGALAVSFSSLFEDKSDADIRAQLIEAVGALPPDERKKLLLTARAWAEAQSEAQ